MMQQASKFSTEVSRMYQVAISSDKMLTDRQQQHMIMSGINSNFLISKPIDLIILQRGRKRLTCRVKSDKFGPVGFSAPLSVLWAL